MSAKVSAESLPDAYFALVKKFPLVHLADENHLSFAQKMLDSLLKEDLDEGGIAYMDALVDLIEIYERKNEPIPDAAPEDVLRELMAANRLSQQKLSEAVGISQSTISAVLNGTRKLTLEQMGKLAKRFNVPTRVFLPG